MNPPSLALASTALCFTLALTACGSTQTRSTTGSPAPIATTAGANSVSASSASANSASELPPPPITVRTAATTQIIGPDGSTLLPSNAPIQATLTTSARALPDGSLCDDYRISLSAGSAITVLVRGGDRTDSSLQGERLDMYVVISLDDVELAHHDDISVENRNSRLLFTAQTTGVHSVCVTTFGSGPKTGAYEIEFREGLHPDAE